MRVLAVIMAASLATLPVRAQDESALVEPDPFEEAVRDGAEISGAALVGLLRHGPAFGPRLDMGLDTFGVDLPWHDPPETICVRIVTSDGLYQASGQYRLAGKAPGARFVYPTEHAAMLDALEPGALAIRATAGACQSPPDPMAVTYVTEWRDAGRLGQAPPTLLVKAFGADEVFLVMPGLPPVPCRALDAGGVSAADHACDLPADLPEGVTPELFALTDGIPSRPVALPIWLRERR